MRVGFFRLHIIFRGIVFVALLRFEVNLVTLLEQFIIENESHRTHFLYAAHGTAVARVESIIRRTVGEQDAKAVLLGTEERRVRPQIRVERDGVELSYDVGAVDALPQRGDYILIIEVQHRLVASEVDNVSVKTFERRLHPDGEMAFGDNAAQHVAGIEH